MPDIKYLQCVKCGRKYSEDEVLYTCPSCGLEGTLDVVYDYDKLKKKFTRESLKANNDTSLWRYIELLPLKNRPKALPLHVGGSPLYNAHRLGSELGLNSLYVKDDGRNPTASLKDRASAVGVAKALELNRKVMCAASTGNAASSLSGFAACAGIPTFIFVPSSAPAAKIAQLLIYGSKVILVDGTYDEAFDLCQRAAEEFNWYNRSCAINPYLIEGKKTAAFEILEQLNWRVPDWMIMSIGDGCCISGMFKGFKEMYELGLIDRIPRLLGVQASGSNPVNRAFREGKNSFDYQTPKTLADSISVGIPRNGLKALRALRESKGDVVDVEDFEILDSMKLMARFTGVFGEPAGVAGLAGLRKFLRKSVIDKDETVVLVVSGNGLKDVSSALKAIEKPKAIKPDIKELRKVLDNNRF